MFLCLVDSLARRGMRSLQRAPKTLWTRPKLNRLVVSMFQKVCVAGTRLHLVRMLFRVGCKADMFFRVVAHLGSQALQDGEDREDQARWRRWREEVRRHRIKNDDNLRNLVRVAFGSRQSLRKVDRARRCRVQERAMSLAFFFFLRFFFFVCVNNRTPHFMVLFCTLRLVTVGPSFYVWT